MIPSQAHHRRSIRLAGYDYAQAGWYFVTICSHGKTCLFGEVVDRKMRLNGLGVIVKDSWADLVNHYHHITLDALVVMPNHLHGIIVLKPVLDVGVGAGLKPAPTSQGADGLHGLGEIIRGLKTFSARRINQTRFTSGEPVWQRNYYEHVIRGEPALNRIRQYILGNPVRWKRTRRIPISRHLQKFRVIGAGFKPAPTTPRETRPCVSPARRPGPL